MMGDGGGWWRMTMQKEKSGWSSQRESGFDETDLTGLGENKSKKKIDTVDSRRAQITKTTQYTTIQHSDNNQNKTEQKIIWYLADSHNLFLLIAYSLT